MKRAIDVPPFGELADPRVLAELAAAAEERGWDGFFVWDHILHRSPAKAIAEVTAGIRRARPDGAPFDVIVDLPPDEDTGPWERAGATWSVTDLGLQPSRSTVLAVINNGPG